MTLIEGTVVFDRSDPVYRNHFPGRPVIPGSLITSAFIDILDGRGIATTGITRARFLRFASPAAYRYSISVDGAAAEWELREGDAVFAEGEFSISMMKEHTDEYHA